MEKLKHFLRKIPFLYSFASRVYQKYQEAVRLNKDTRIQRQIEKVFRTEDRVFFVQVGSNDGIRKDPIHNLILQNHNWSGIFIEPVGFIFKRLKNNYKNAERFIFENTAIGAMKSKEKFYYVSQEAKTKLGDQLSGSYEQYGSFNKEHIIKGLGDQIIPFIIEEEIECTTLGDIIARNNVTKIDLLHIDTEGFDYKVLAQVEFAKFKPKIILYEHTHLDIDEYKKARSLLMTNGYKISENGVDTLAILK